MQQRHSAQIQVFHEVLASRVDLRRNEPLSYGNTAAPHWRRCNVTWSWPKTTCQKGPSLTRERRAREEPAAERIEGWRQGRTQRWRRQRGQGGSYFCPQKHAHPGPVHIFCKEKHARPPRCTETSAQSRCPAPQTQSRGVQIGNTTKNILKTSSNTKP